MLKSVSILVLLLFIAPLASAEIFRCVAKNGLGLYQNFPCEFDSIGSMTMEGQVPKELSASTDSRSTTRKSATSRALASVNASAVQTGLRIGMTTEDVRAIWGEPTDTQNEEPGDGPRSEVWTYGGARSVRFDRKGRVIALKQ